MKTVINHISRHLQTARTWAAPGMDTFRAALGVQPQLQRRAGPQSRLRPNTRRLAGALALGAVLLSGCASNKAPAPAVFDFGALRADGGHAVSAMSADRGAGQQDPGVNVATPTRAGANTGSSAPRLPAVALADISAPSWLDSPIMYYRLDYANELEPQPYADSRWNMPPADLFGQRLKSRLGQAGGAVISASDGAIDVPVVRVEVDEFMQRFTSPSQSKARIVVRVAVLKDRSLLAQRTFSAEAPAPTGDAAGGVRALANASDAAIGDIIAWLAGLPLKR